MTFPTVQSVTSGNVATDQTSHNVVLPATINAGDVLLIIFTADGTPTITWDNATAGTWRQVLAGSSPAYQIRTKIADGTEGGATLGITTSAAEQSAWQIYRISGSAGDIGVTSAAAGSIGPPSLTTPWSAADTLWIASGVYDNGTVNPTVQANYGNLAVSRTSTTDGVGVVSSRRNLNAATEDPASFGSSGSTNNAFTIGVRPGTTSVPPDAPHLENSTFSNGGAAATSHAITLPPVIVPGDLLVVFLMCRSSATVTWDNATAGTWTQAFDRRQAVGRPHSVCYFKVADGSEDGLTLNVTTSSSEVAPWRVMRFKKASGNVEAVSADAGGTNTPNAPILTPSWGAKDTLWIAYFGVEGGASSLTTPPIFYASIGTEGGSSGVDSRNIYAARALHAPDENPSIATIAGSGYQTVVATIAIEPGAGGGPDPGPGSARRRMLIVN